MINFISNYLLIFVIIADCQGAYNIYLKSIKCFNINSDIVSLPRCEVKAERGKHGVLYLIGIFKQPVTKEMKLRVT